MTIASRAYNEGDFVYDNNTLYKVIAPTASYFCSSHSSIDTKKLYDSMENTKQNPECGRAYLTLDTPSNTLPMMTLAEYNALSETYTFANEVNFGEPDFKLIRYRSICMCCGAPVNDYGKCEYCGTAHQYAD